jgi:uncharacterized protein
MIKQFIPIALCIATIGNIHAMRLSPQVIKKLLPEERMLEEKVYHSSSLIIASKENDALQIKELLAHHDPNEQNRLGNTALHEAIIHEDSTSAHVLADNRTKLDIQNMYGETPLYLAVCYNRFNLVRHMLEKKANPNIPNERGIFPLMRAIYDNHASIAQLFSSDERTDINARGYQGNTALHIAAAMFHGMAYIPALLARGVKKDICNEAGQTPKDIANGKNNAHIIYLLTYC